MATMRIDVVSAEGPVDLLSKVSDVHVDHV